MTRGIWSRELEEKLVKGSIPDGICPDFSVHWLGIQSRFQTLMASLILSKYSFHQSKSAYILGYSQSIASGDLVENAVQNIA